METLIETNWKREEFKAYLLSYAANSNYFESEAEKTAILNMVPATAYAKVHKELAEDNDYQSIQKILYNIKKFNYTPEELDVLVNDIQKLFNANEEHDILEENMLRALKKLLH